MKTYISSKFLASLLAAVFGILLSGCGPDSPNGGNPIDGKYVRVRFGVSDTIVINADGSFRQDVTYTNGSAWSTNGTWQVNNRAVSLFGSYQSYDGEKQAVIIPPREIGGRIFVIEKDTLFGQEVEPPWIRTKD